MIVKIQKCIVLINKHFIYYYKLWDFFSCSFRSPTPAPLYLASNFALQNLACEVTFTISVIEVCKELSILNHDFWYPGNFTNTHATFYRAAPSSLLSDYRIESVADKAFVFSYNQFTHSGQLHPHTEFGTLTQKFLISICIKIICTFGTGCSLYHKI